MIKKKTHSGASKRFKKLKNGSVKAMSPGRRHGLTKKTRKVKRTMRKTYYINASDVARIRAVL